MKDWLKHIVLVIFLLPVLLAKAGEMPQDSIQPIPKDTNVHNLREFFSKGKFSGNLRNYFMSTLNQGQLTDYWANATGGKLGYRTTEWKGLSFGMEGIYLFNLASSDLSHYDSLGQGISRYELQLFDLESPGNRYDLDLLSQLYLRYRFHKTSIRVGRQVINTPLVNPQDARMKPYLMAGAWIESKALPHWTFNGGYFWGASPRSTTRWTGIGDAMGIYGDGYNPDGSKADYSGYIKTKGLAIAGAVWEPSKTFRIQLWDYWLENVLNTAFLQAEYDRQGWLGGIQILRQDPVGSGGATETGHYYYQPGDRANLFALRAGWHSRDLTLTANYSRILGTGRFVFPREFGREQLFTTISRGRFEGFGDLHALILRSQWKPSNLSGLSLKIEGGRVWTPGDGVDFALNKYGIASYDALNLDLGYSFPQVLQGLELRFLYVSKYNTKSYPGRYDLVFNKSNFHQFNFITNLNF